MKDFLQQYCEGRRLAGYIMYQDPLAMFYEAVCVGIDFNGNVNADYFQLPPPPTVSGDAHVFALLRVTTLKASHM